MTALFVPLACGIGTFNQWHVESIEADLTSQYRAYVLSTGLWTGRPTASLLADVGTPGFQDRGVLVLAAVRPVPEGRPPNLLAMVSLMFAALVVLAGLIWRRQRVAHFRELYEREVDREALREQAEVALKASESMFRSLAESVPAAIWVTDATGKTTYTNQRFIDLRDCPPARAGQGWREPIHPENRAAFREIARVGLERHVSYEVLCRVRTSPANIDGY